MADQPKFVTTIHFQSTIHFQLQFTCTWSGPWSNESRRHICSSSLFPKPKSSVFPTLFVVVFKLPFTKGRSPFFCSFLLYSTMYVLWYVIYMFLMSKCSIWRTKVIYNYVPRRKIIHYIAKNLIFRSIKYVHTSLSLDRVSWASVWWEIKGKMRKKGISIDHEIILFFTSSQFICCTELKKKISEIKKITLHTEA